MENKLTQWVTILVTVTLCVVVVGMVGTLLAAILDPNIPNDPILAIIAPSFNMIIGGFIGLITGIHMAQGEDDDK
jgi:O-antigen/teichoic acid export membrane protein